MALRYDIYADNPKFMKVSLCQVYTQEWDLNGNFTRTVDALKIAAENKADLAITPECVLHGYGFIEDYKNIRNKIKDYAQNINGEMMLSMRNTVKKLGIAAVIGFAEVDDKGVFYNSAVLFAKNGDISYVYRKVHCRPFENELFDGCFRPGEEFFVDKIETDELSVNIGTMICFDREIPESTRCLRALGAQFIACPLATKTTDIYDNNIADNEFVTRCRALENEVFIAVVNHAGRFNGGSILVGPGGEIITQLGTGPEVKTIDVPIEVISRKFHSNPLGWMGFGYRRPEIYTKYL